LQALTLIILPLAVHLQVRQTLKPPCKFTQCSALLWGARTPGYAKIA